MRLIPSLMGGSRYRAGDWVVVRSKEEILATLDENGCLDGMPFQPEMLQLCGRKTQVFAVAHKTCEYNTAKADGRKVRKAVHLTEGRCDGSAHDGCQQHCHLFWRDEWLRPADSAAGTARPSAAPKVDEAALQRLTRVSPDGTPPEDLIYRCQTTELRRVTEHLPFWDVRQYVDDVTSRNLRVSDIAWLLAGGILRHLMRTGVLYRVWRGLHDKLAAKRHRPGIGDYVGKIPLGSPTPTERLDLMPGDTVVVRPWPEIETSLNIEGANRGMRFDYEMTRYIGQTYKVEARIDRIIHEKTSKMTVMKSPCIQLEGVHCRAECTGDRLGCPRKGRTFWREIWLKRV